MAAKLLRWFAFVWFTLAGGVIFVSCAALWYTEGFSKVQEVFSPFNLANFVVTLVTLGPGIGAYVLADRLEQRADTRTIDAAVARANELVQSYGRALEAAASTKGMVADSDRLPAPKDEIKAALFVALRLTEDPQVREQLKVSYLELATFQPGAGHPVTFPAVPDADDSEAIRAAAERAPGLHRWLTAASEERERLVEELRRAGF